jgi:hypothetical protein
MNEQVFQFAYTILRIEARLSAEHVSARIGLRQIHVHISRIQHLFLDGRKERDNVELVISYRDRRNRLRRARLFADHGESGLTDLHDAILARRPGINLTDVTPQQAYSLMGSSSSEAVAIPGLMFAAYMLVALLCTPLFIHGGDDGLHTSPIENIDLTTQSNSRNLQISGGVLLLDEAVFGSSGERSSDPLTRVWVPLVAPSWTPEQDVKVVVKLRVRDLDVLKEAPLISGVLRNVWWEGLNRRTIRLLGEKGARATPKTWLLEAGSHGHDDQKVAYLILGLLAFPLLGVTVVLRSRYGSKLG